MEDLPENVQFVIYDYAGAPLICALIRLGELNPRYTVAMHWEERVQARERAEGSDDDEVSESVNENLKIALAQVARNGDVAGFKRLFAMCDAYHVYSGLVEAALTGAGDRRDEAGKTADVSGTGMLPGVAGTKMSADAAAAKLVYLMRRSADPKYPFARNDVDFALNEAAMTGDSAAVSFLLDLRQRVPNKAPRFSVDSEPFPRSNPVSLAFECGRLENMKLLLDRGFPRPKLSVFEAARRGHGDICEWLLDGEASRLAVLNGATCGGRAVLVRRLGLRWSADAEAALTVGFYSGAANPKNRETLAALKELGWLQPPAVRKHLLESAFAADNTELVEDLAGTSLDALAAPDETSADVVEAIWDGLLNCAARGGEKTLQAGARCPLILDACRREAQALLDAQAGLLPPRLFLGGRKPAIKDWPTVAAPPSASVPLFRTLCDWGARVDARHVRYAAYCCSRALFREVFEAAPPSARALDPKIFRTLARKGATIGRLAMVQALAFPGGIPHETIRDIVRLDKKTSLGFRPQALAPLAAEPREFVISVGVAATEACQLWPEPALAFFLLGAKLAAFQPLACWRPRRAKASCAQAALLEALQDRPDANTSLSGLPESNRKIEIRLCALCEKALDRLRPQKHKRKRRG
jgi:hypothetical protein